MNDEPESAAAVPASAAGSIAGQVASVDEMIMNYLPFVSTILGVIPGAQVGVPIVAGIGALLKVVDSAAKAIAEGNPNSTPQSIISELESHNTPGAPNSPALAPSEPAAA